MADVTCARILYNCIIPLITCMWIYFTWECITNYECPIMQQLINYSLFCWALYVGFVSWCWLLPWQSRAHYLHFNRSLITKSPVNYTEHCSNFVLILIYLVIVAFSKRYVCFNLYIKPNNYEHVLFWLLLKLLYNYLCYIIFVTALKA